MEARCLYFTVHCCSNLLDVRHFGEMKVYAKVTISGNTKCTEVDLVNGTNPNWNTTLCFIVPENHFINGRISAFIELFAQRTFGHDKFVGEVVLSLYPRYKGMCTSPVLCRSDSKQSFSYGNLTFSHTLGDKLIVVDTLSSSSEKDSDSLIDLIKIGVDVANAVATALS